MKTLLILSFVAIQTIGVVYNSIQENYVISKLHPEMYMETTVTEHGTWVDLHTKLEFTPHKPLFTGTTFIYFNRVKYIIQIRPIRN